MKKKKSLFSFFKGEHKHKWGTIKTIWPYSEGYGVYCKECRTVLETGITEDAAIALANEMNAGTI